MLNDELRNKHYCTSSQEIVALILLSAHNERKHDSDRCDDLIPIVYEEDGHPVAEPGNCGHYPHFWHEIDGQDLCADCGAIKISQQAVDRFLNQEADR